jgi:hypothetical protein
LAIASPSCRGRRKVGVTTEISTDMSHRPCQSKFGCAPALQARTVLLRARTVL